MTGNKYWLYLEKLRRSGATNMYGAAPYLANKFGLTMSEAENILVDWMEKYNPDDYKETGKAENITGGSNDTRKTESKAIIDSGMTRDDRKALMELYWAHADFTSGNPMEEYRNCGNEYCLSRTTKNRKGEPK